MCAWVTATYIIAYSILYICSIHEIDGIYIWSHKFQLLLLNIVHGLLDCVYQYVYMVCTVCMQCRCSEINKEKKHRERSHISKAMPRTKVSPP